MAIMAWVNLFCNEALVAAVDLAKESGLAYVGVSQTSHSGTLSYYVKKRRNKAWLLFRCVNLIQWWYRLVVQAIIFGTNPIAFAAPRAGHEPVVFDMATTVQAWGKNFRCTFKRC
ncbi:Ldh family oxidoreductase [Enterococcus faecalis]|uniref:Ldh family oxidoreductase n=1 Tax=Enterococcus faecalis TaxID=1351 RepID=A0A974NZ68_ENTFL|nr:Ldh family oxidoreductase [Enterococcus faecalis]